MTEAQSFRNDTLGKDIQAILWEIVVVEKDNLMDTVIKDGFAKYEDVYANVSAGKRPPNNSWKNIIKFPLI